MENVFGILALRFDVLPTTLEVAPENAQTIVVTCCYLHNFLLKEQSYTFEDLIERGRTSSDDLVQEAWRESVNPNVLEYTRIRNSK